MKKLTLICAVIFSASIAFAREVRVSVGAGENYRAKREPQIAVWVEDADGNFIRTLYVTERASRRSWIFAPKSGRPESLPVWYHASKNADAKKSNGGAEENGLDAVTGATPKGGAVFSAEIPNGVCVVKAEVNASFDYNDFYTKKNSGVNGQPSVVYTAKIPADFNEGEIALAFAGTGSLDGSNGAIESANKEHLTTALSIVSRIFVSAKRAEFRGMAGARP